MFSQSLDNLTDCSLYVDDFCICYRSKSMATIERQLQQNLNKIENWATSNGFKFSKSKTQCVHFCQLRKQHDDTVLHLYGSPIPVVEESKFLGILFDRKLSYIHHIKYLKAKCLKALNLFSTFPYFLGCRQNYTSHLLVCLFVCCFTSQVNSYGHCGTVSSPNHTFSWAGLNKR